MSKRENNSTLDPLISLGIEIQTFNIIYIGAYLTII